MKKTLSIILFILLCIILAAALFCCVYSICDINRVLDELAKDPSASGIDYMGGRLGIRYLLIFLLDFRYDPYVHWQETVAAKSIATGLCCCCGYICFAHTDIGFPVLYVGRFPEGGGPLTIDSYGMPSAYF